jgi:hypothetical protein
VPYPWQPEPETYNDEAILPRGVSAHPDGASQKLVERAFLYQNPDPESQFRREYEQTGDIEAVEAYEINLLEVKDTSTMVIQLMTELNDTLCTTLYGDGVSGSSQLSYCGNLVPLAHEDPPEAMADVGDGGKVKDAVLDELRHDIAKCLFCLEDWARWKGRGYSDVPPVTHHGDSSTSAGVAATLDYAPGGTSAEIRPSSHWVPRLG